LTILNLVVLVTTLIFITIFSAYYYFILSSKPHNSLIQFGYSLDLLRNPHELDPLKKEIQEKPLFHLSVGNKYVFAKNGYIMIHGYAGVAKLNQFTTKELELIEQQQKFAYHSIDSKGIWFEIITDPDLDRIERKPYPFR
jgi:hypothetical protein